MRPEFESRSDPVCAVDGLADDGEVVDVGEGGAEPVPEQWMVVDDQDADGHVVGLEGQGGVDQRA